jgi:hypothetical protein
VRHWVNLLTLKFWSSHLSTWELLWEAEFWQVRYQAQEQEINDIPWHYTEESLCRQTESKQKMQKF